MNLDERMTQGAFGELVGISRQAVGGYIRAGTLKRDATAGEWLLAYCDRLRKQAAGTGGEGLAVERTRLAKEQADAKAMENAATRREFVKVDAVQKHWVGMFTTARAIILAVPHTLAPLIARETDPGKCHDLVEAELHRALHELAGDGVPAK